jgi:hypothetical protein
LIFNRTYKNEKGGYDSALEEFSFEQGDVCENCADDSAYNNCLDTLDSLTEAPEDEMGCINGILGEDYFSEAKKKERMERR